MLDHNTVSEPPNKFSGICFRVSILHSLHESPAVDALYAIGENLVVNLFLRKGHLPVLKLDSQVIYSWDYNSIKLAYAFNLSNQFLRREEMSQWTNFWTKRLKIAELGRKIRV